MLHAFLVVVQIVSAICIIVLVILQRGKGAEAGAGFGAGASGTVFGARGASTALSRATAIFAIIFMVNSLALTYMSTRPHAQRTTILDLAASQGQTKPSTAGAAGSPAPAPAAAHGSSGTANSGPQSPAITHKTTPQQPQK